MNNTLWITEYEINGEEHRFYYLGDTTDNDACSTACYNIVAVGEDGEETYKEGRTWNDNIDDYTDSFVEELKANGYIIR